MWMLVLIGAALLGVFVMATGLATRGPISTKARGALIALALLVGVTAVFWKHAIVALAISAVCALAVGVMFQKVHPSNAIRGALAAFLLMFVFSWLALQLSEPLLFGGESRMSTWVGDRIADLEAVLDPAAVVLAVGAACLLAAGPLRRRGRALLVFAGALLMFLSAPTLLRQLGLSIPGVLSGHHPISRLAILVGIVICVVGAVRELTSSKGP